MDPLPYRRAELLAATDLADLHDLADALLGPARACPGRHRFGPAPAVELIAGGPPRWRCAVCGDGGTAVDLVALAAQCDADEALARLIAWRAERQRPPVRRAPPEASRVGRRMAALAIAVHDGHTEREVVVEAASTATIGDLARALMGEPGALDVDGAMVPASTRLSGSLLREGSTVSVPGAQSTPGAEDWAGEPAAVVELRWVGGLDAGRVDRLAPGLWLAGSAAAARLRRADAGAGQAAMVDVGPRGELVVESLRAGAAEVDLEPAGATAVGRVRGELRIGGGVAVVAPVAPAPRDRERRIGGMSRSVAPGSGRWTVPVVRRAEGSGAGRTAGPDQPPAEVVPAAMPPPPGATSVVPALVSLVAGVVLAVVAHQPLLLILGGVGAVGSLGTWAWQRGRYRRARRRAKREAGDALRAFELEQAAWLAAQDQDRRSRHPDLTVVADRISGAEPGLWAHRLAPGIAIPIAVGAALPAAALSGTAGPVVADLMPGAALAVTGPPGDALAVARGLLLRLATDHGPADLAVSVVTADPAAWAWTAWLPHTGGPHRTASADAAASKMPSALQPIPGAVLHEPEWPERAVVLVIDDPRALEVRTGPARRALAAGATALVIAPPAADLPHVCRDVLQLDCADAARRQPPTGTLHRAASTTIEPTGVAGLSSATALRLARELARYHDPEQADGTAALPSHVRLVELLGPRAADPAAMAASWATQPGGGGGPGALRVPLAVAEDGIVEIDLVADGPHALVAGTTGSGKSELLRSLVAGLAAAHAPSEVTFLLVDYKGGSAFDACARLPHVVGVVTDLDGHLAERALRSLHAELRRREATLRAAGCDDIDAARARGAALSRLVVVIDEFAALAAELPEFLRAIVAVAQRGRSLGVHLVLATQRPGTAVSDEIRANTNLRVSLRVQSAADSNDIVGIATAARIPRNQPGRAVLRLSGDEHVPIQTARVTGSGCLVTGPVTIRPMSQALPHPEPALAEPTLAEPGPSDLSALVTVVRQAAVLAREAAPHRPWLDPLPERIPLDALPAGTVALADWPDDQHQAPIGWEPTRGHVLLLGGPGSGTTTALAALALDLARAEGPDDVHLLIADFGRGALAPLSGLSHVGAVVRAGEGERAARLVRTLRRELERRQLAATDPAPGGEALLVLVVDGLPALRAELEDPRHELLDDLDRVLAEGPRHGIVMAATADRAGSVPLALATVTAQKWVFQPADRAELASFGLGSTDVAAWTPGRFVTATERIEAQIGCPGDLAVEVGALAERWPPASRTPPVIGRMPRAVTLDDLAAAGPPVPGCCELAVGIGHDELLPVSLRIHPGDHVLVAGPARSGRTTALAMLAQQLRYDHPNAWMGAVTPRRSLLERAIRFDAVASTVAGLGPLPEEAWLLVDDAELVDGDAQMAERLGRLDPGLHVLAAARADSLRGAFGHWTQHVRRSRLGALLQPDVLVDGDLLGVVLPRHGPAIRTPGRGYLVGEGHVEPVQLAQPRAGEEQEWERDQPGEATAPRRPGLTTPLRAACSSARAAAVGVGPAARIIAAPASDMSAASV